MALSSAIDNMTGKVPAQPKIIPPHSEKCMAPNNCQYWVDGNCILESCPFKANKTMVAAGTDTSGKTVNPATKRKCFICGEKFDDFIGAIPICKECKYKIVYLVVTPHCPGCGAVVDTPATICESCRRSYTRY